MGNGNKPLPQNISYSCLKVCWQASKYNDWKLQTSKHTCTQDLFPVPSPVHPVLQIEVVSGSCAIQVSEETLPHPQATETAGPLSGQAWGCTVWTLPVSMDTTSLQCPSSGHYQSPMPKFWTLPVSNAQALDTANLHGHYQSPMPKLWTLPVSMDTTSLQCPKSGHYQSPWTLPASSAQALDTTSLQQSPSKCTHRQLGPQHLQAVLT